MAVTTEMSDRYTLVGEDHTRRQYEAQATHILELYNSYPNLSHSLTLSLSVSVSRPNMIIWLLLCAKVCDYRLLSSFVCWFSLLSFNLFKKRFFLFAAIFCPSSVLHFVMNYCNSCVFSEMIENWERFFAFVLVNNLEWGFEICCCKKLKY